MFLSELKTAFPKTMLSAMDFTIDPCDNFFEYSCGDWQKLATIPPELGGVAKSWDAAQDAADADLHKIMLKQYPKDSVYRKVMLQPTTLRKTLISLAKHHSSPHPDFLGLRGTTRKTLLSLRLVPHLFALAHRKIPGCLLRLHPLILQFFPLSRCTTGTSLAWTRTR